MSSISDAQLLQSLLTSAPAGSDSLNEEPQSAHSAPDRRESRESVRNRGRGNRRKELGIFVKQLTGRTAQFQGYPTDSVRTLKLKIQDKLGVPVDQCRLLFNSKQLSDECTLEDVGIVDESILFLVTRVASREEVPPESLPLKQETPSSSSADSVDCSSPSRPTINARLSLVIKVKGRTITLLVAPDDSLGDLVDMIRDKFQIPDNVEIRLQRQERTHVSTLSKGRRRATFVNISMNLEASLRECEFSPEEVLNVVQEPRRVKQLNTIQVTNSSRFDRLRIVLGALWAHIALWLASKPLLVACFRRMISVRDVLVRWFCRTVVPHLQTMKNRLSVWILQPIYQRSVRLCRAVQQQLHFRLLQPLRNHWTLVVIPRFRQLCDNLRLLARAFRTNNSLNSVTRQINDALNAISRACSRGVSSIRTNIGPIYIRFCIAFYNRCNELIAFLRRLFLRAHAWSSPKLLIARLAVHDWMHDNVVNPLDYLSSILVTRFKDEFNRLIDTCQRFFVRLFDSLQHFFIRLFDSLQHRLLPLRRTINQWKNSFVLPAVRWCFNLLCRLELQFRRYFLPRFIRLFNPLNRLEQRFVAWLTWTQGPISNCGVRVSVVPAVRIDQPRHPHIHGVFALRDQQDYSIVFQNTTTNIFFAQVSIDGQQIGLLTIRGQESFTLERFIDSYSRFRFVAHHAPLSASSKSIPTEGVIEVKFRCYQNLSRPTRSLRRNYCIAPDFDNNQQVAETENEDLLTADAEEMPETIAPVISGRTERGALSYQLLQNGLVSEGNVSDIIETLRIQLVLQQTRLN